VLVGGPGSGKTATCLRFLAEGLDAGEAAMMLTVARGADVKAQARTLGIELDDALRQDRLVFLRYRTDFSERLARAASPAKIVDELVQSAAWLAPSRIVIDSFAPFVSNGPCSGEAISALLAFLGRSGATSVLTYPEDVRHGYDRRLEPIMQNAAAIVRLSSRRRRHRAESTGIDSPTVLPAPSTMLTS
jgi:KaiC/GvpD/RAD55 family RecA-like ATPase